MVWPSRLVLEKKFFWIWFIYTLEGCALVLHFFILTKCHLWNTLMSPHDMSRHGEQKSSWLFWYYSLSNSNLLYSANKKNTGPGRLLLFTFLAQGESESEVQGRGERYPNWFNSIFEFCQKMIQFNIQFNSISRKFNSRDYPIQYFSQKFNSKNYSIQKISKKFNSKNYSIQKFSKKINSIGNSIQ